jgi:antitoxin component of RelBE/YafQ-DinJ toxin-antitoxin module
MATRTVRLDDEAEAMLAHVCKSTGLGISEALKRGLQTLLEQVNLESSRIPYDVYRQLDLGPGGYLIAASRETRQGVRKAIRKKLRR